MILHYRFGSDQDDISERDHPKALRGQQGVQTKSAESSGQAGACVSVDEEDWWANV